MVGEDLMKWLLPEFIEDILPAEAKRVEVDGKPIELAQGGQVLVPTGTKRVIIEFTELVKKPTAQRK